MNWLHGIMHVQFDAGYRFAARALMRTVGTITTNCSPQHDLELRNLPKLDLLPQTVGNILFPVSWASMAT